MRQRIMPRLEKVEGKSTSKGTVRVKARKLSVRVNRRQSKNSEPEGHPTPRPTEAPASSPTQAGLTWYDLEGPPTPEPVLRKEIPARPPSGGGLEYVFEWQRVKYARCVVDLPLSLVESTSQTLQERGTDLSTMTKIALLGMRNAPSVFELDSKLSFGKYAGQTLEDLIKVDPSYILWCLRGTSFFRMDIGAADMLQKITSVDVMKEYADRIVIKTSGKE